ncbi:glycosyltransferase family 4 protein [bacterium]|nr:glycosyltransferase family 4 protein [bacterium]
MRLCMVGYTQFESDGRLHRYATSLLSQGHSVDVVGLGESVQKSPVNIAGVNVYRIHRRDFQESGPLSYLKHLTIFFWKSFIITTRLHIQKKYHVIHFHNIPDFGIFCTILTKFLGAKIILDVHDLVPEFYMRKFHVSESHLIIVLLKFIEKLSCRYANHVITVTELWREKLIQRSVNSRHCSVIMNLPIHAIFKKQPFNSYKTGNFFYLTYHGNLAEQTGVDLLIRAVRKLTGRIPNIRLQIIGGGREETEYRQLTDTLELNEQIIFKNNVPVIQLTDAVKHAHIAVDPKRPGVYAGETLSVKAMEYLALGIPLVVAETEAASYYFPRKSVRFFKPGNADSLASAILDLYLHPDKRRKLYKHSDDFNRKYNWEDEKQTYFSILSKLTGLEANPEK